MRCIQLNVQEFRYFEKVISYLKDQQADVITIQEAVDGGYGHHHPPKDTIQQLRNLGYAVIYGPNYGVATLGNQGNSSRGNAICTRYPVTYSQQHFFYPYGEYTTKTPEELGRHHDEENIITRTKRWIIGRSLPCSILEAIVKTGEDKHLRILTVHFHPSPQCTETYQMIQMATFLCQILKYSSSIPTILCGDFNLQAPSASFFMIQDYLDHITNTFQNTLHPSLHAGFKNDIAPTGYQVDHIFAKGLHCTKRHVDQVDISDHFPVIGTFSLP